MAAPIAPTDAMPTPSQIPRFKPPPDRCTSPGFPAEGSDDGEIPPSIPALHSALAASLLPDLPLLLHAAGGAPPDSQHPRSVATVAELTASHIFSLLDSVVDAHILRYGHSPVGAPRVGGYDNEEGYGAGRHLPTPDMVIAAAAEEAAAEEDATELREAIHTEDFIFALRRDAGASREARDLLAAAGEVRSAVWDPIVVAALLEAEEEAREEEELEEGGDTMAMIMRAVGGGKGAAAAVAAAQGGGT